MLLHNDSNIRHTVILHYDTTKPNLQGFWETWQAHQHFGEINTKCPLKHTFIEAAFKFRTNKMP